MEEYITFMITSSTGEEIEMAVVDEFQFENRDYVAASRVVDDTIDQEGIFIYRVKPGDEFAVEKINNKIDYEKVARAYMDME